MAANSALTRMLSWRTLRDTSANRWARICTRVSRFMRSIARRMYSARGSRSAAAQSVLVSSRSSGSFSEIAAIVITLEYHMLIFKKYTLDGYPSNQLAPRRVDGLRAMLTGVDD